MPQSPGFKGKSLSVSHSTKSPIASRCSLRQSRCVSQLLEESSKLTSTRRHTLHSLHQYILLYYDCLVWQLRHLWTRILDYILVYCGLKSALASQARIKRYKSRIRIYRYVYFTRNRTLVMKNLLLYYIYIMFNWIKYYIIENVSKTYLKHFIIME